MAMLVGIVSGGTLTDTSVIDGPKVFHAKTLTSPHDLTNCFAEVLREAPTEIYGEPKLATLLEEVDCIRCSTTQGTNAVVQRIAQRLGKGSDVQELIRNVDERTLFATLVGERVGSIDLGLEGDDFATNIGKAINEPMHYCFVPELQNSNSGKILKTELREWLAAENGAMDEVASSRAPGVQ